jgi:ubiquinone/menaquinone biosynthesis C-methylase UbiE
MKKVLCGSEMDRMPNWAFRIMAFMFKITDIFKSTENKLDPFDIQKGQTVVDYGSGTGRYLRKASELVGDNGLVYAIDIQELAIKSAFRMIEKYDLKNVKPVLADGWSVNLPTHTADIVYALDMFHMIGNPGEFLKELNRITKTDGILYLENGHQPRTLAKDKVSKSGFWEITDETKTFLKCKPKSLEMSEKQKIQ